MELIKFIFIYNILLISILGYGFLFSVKFTNYNNFNLNKISIGYIGIFGILFLITISYFTNLFVPHNDYHNITIIFAGIIIFMYFYLRYRKKIFNKFFLFAYLISFFSLFFFKNHDDFSYYHLSFINNITLNKIEFGTNNFDIAFNHTSSLFYFHSLLKTFFTKSYFYQIGQLSIVIFANTILFEKLFINKKNQKLDISFFLGIFFLLFINIFFYRLAEHGTDRSAQILFFLVFFLSIIILQYKKLDKSIFELIIIIFTLLITMKSFYLLYLILFIYLYIKYFKIYQLKNLFNSFPIIYFCLFSFTLMLIHNIASSGCLLYPVPFTCNSSFFWGYGKENVANAMQWYEVWSKAGATPDYRVENFSKYIKNFNWVSNWLDNYFFNKMSDYLLGIIFSIIVVVSIFKVKFVKFKNLKKYFPILSILTILILEWFLNHPTLRYGGYVLFFLVIILPICMILEDQGYKFKNKIKSINLVVSLILIVSVARNIDRIMTEIEIYNYNFIKSPYYNVQENFFTMKNRKIENFYDTSICNINNSRKEVKCSSIKTYNFYYKIKN